MASARSASSIPITDTPLKRNASASGVFINGTLDDQRQAVMSDLGNIPEVTVDFMLDHIIPDSGVNVEATKKALERDDVLLDSGWQIFNGVMPKNFKEPEQEVFAKMATIYEQILACTMFRSGRFRAGCRPSPVLKLGTCPDIAPISPTNVRTRPDGCGQLVSDHPTHTAQAQHSSAIKGQYHWFNIAYVEEYKKKNTKDDLSDNVLKILWSLHHMMNIDHRRRFAFGVTIENTDTRVWFCCRQIVFVTRPFDFMNEPAILIRLVSSLAYADTTQLGYDPTMKLVWKNKTWNYRIAMAGKDNAGETISKTYETTSLISDTSFNIRGRATRVYEAYDVEIPGTLVVLKDSWVDGNRPREADTLATILEGASDEEMALFLTVLHHGVVMIDGKEDLTQDLLMRGHVVSIDHLFEAEGILEEDDTGSQMATLLEELHMNDYDDDGPEASSEVYSVHDTAQTTTVHKAGLFKLNQSSQPKSRTGTRSSSASATSTDVIPHANHSKMGKPRVYAPKAHYRLVFKERGSSLHHIAFDRQARLPLLMHAMRDIIQALSVMSRKGYVHRDISTGNIIMYEGRARLADLEFAKEYGTGTLNNVRTGTFNFMAVEVEKDAYHYNSAVQFFHNPLHDLESLWWVGVWFMFWHYSPNAALLTPVIQTHLDAVEQIGLTLFPNHFTTEKHRLEEVMVKKKFISHPWTHFVKGIQIFYARLERFRVELSKHYTQSEKSFPINRSYFTTDLHHTFRDFFDEQRRGAIDDVQLWPLQYIREQHIPYLQHLRDKEKATTGR
ncbi:hypothetical protein BDZ97DRAFT_2074195 [Flammula alnicola]|nr:hypothetical protein BDZ97DRAFT_2074195 [Flammula alnicola]